MISNGYGVPISTTALSDGSWIEMAESWSRALLPLCELGQEAAALRILQLLTL